MIVSIDASATAVSAAPSAAQLQHLILVANELGTQQGLPDEAGSQQPPDEPREPDRRTVLQVRAEGSAAMPRLAEGLAEMSRRSPRAKRKRVEGAQPPQNGNAERKKRRAPTRRIYYPD